MPYAVMQKKLEPLSVEQLKRAFREVPGLAEMDAYTLGKDAFGILVKDFDWERASALKSALATQGVEVEVVDEASLPQLPPSRQVHRVDCLPEALMIYDPAGRSFALEWKHIMLIAAGWVKMSDFNRVMMPFPKRVGREVVMVQEPVTQEQRNQHLALEIVVTRAVLRYSIIADRPGGFSFQYLGARQVRGVAANFSLVVQDMLKFAPNATVNFGASCIRENNAKPFIYPGKTAFFQEIMWLLWQMSSQTNPG
jgi:hypothetical protein